MKKRKSKIMFISSCGGHLTELLQLKKLINKYNSIVVTEKSSDNISLKSKYRVKYLIHGSKDHMLTYPFIFLYNSIKSLFIYLAFRPDYIISTGAHVAGVMSLIGKIFGSKVIFIETFANTSSRTVTGKLLYPFCDLFIVQHKEMLKLYKDAKYGGWIF